MKLKRWAAVGMCAGWTAFILACGGNGETEQTNQTEVEKPSDETSQNSQTQKVNEEWIPHSKAAQQGDFRVSVLGASVGKVNLKSLFGDSSSSQDELLQIRLRIENMSKSRKITFRGWGIEQLDFDTDGAAHLEDEIGNSYRKIHFGTAKIVGQTRSESLYPGKSLDDVVVFELPIPAAKELLLTLPAAAFDGEGVLKFRIPTSVLKPQSAEALIEVETLTKEEKQPEPKSETEKPIPESTEKPEPTGKAANNKEKENKNPLLLTLFNPGKNDSYIITDPPYAVTQLKWIPDYAKTYYQGGAKLKSEMEKKGQIRRIPEGSRFRVVDVENKPTVGAIKGTGYCTCILLGEDAKPPTTVYIFQTYFNDNFMKPIAPPPLSSDEQVEKTEKAAASKLRLAQQFIDKGEKSKARDWLSDIIKEYPKTEAAKTAKEKLDTLK